MIAAMRPSQAHTTAPSVHANPSSRNSSHGNSPAVGSAPTQSKSERLAAKAAGNIANGVSSKKGSTAKKVAKAQQDSEDSHNNDKPSSTPGLITLSKPISEELQASKQPTGSSKHKKAKGAKFANDEGLATPIKSTRSKKSKSSPKADSSEMLLSKSAPSAPLTHIQQPAHDKQADAGDAGLASGLGSGLTWQQELFKQASRTNLDPSQNGNGSRRQNKKSAASTKHDGNLAHPQRIQDDRDSPALTWQQELLGAKKRTGPHFDVFFDARDVETFGADDGAAHGNIQLPAKGGKRRLRAGSFGSGGQKNGKGPIKARSNDVPLHIDDLFESAKPDSLSSAKSQSQRDSATPAYRDANLHMQYPSHGAPIHIAPTTPARKTTAGNQQHSAVAAAIAYAGPNFHNSPSPASLPAPKFHTRLGKNSSDLERGTMRPSSLAAGSSGDSNASDEEVELARGVRSTTAPAEMAPTPSKASTAAVVSSNGVAAAESPSRKTSMQPGATVESLLARMLGGAQLN